VAPPPPAPAGARTGCGGLGLDRLTAASGTAPAPARVTGTGTRSGACPPPGPVLVGPVGGLGGLGRLCGVVRQPLIPPQGAPGHVRPPSQRGASGRPATIPAGRPARPGCLVVGCRRSGTMTR
jgi:hypothetical protein